MRVTVLGPEDGDILAPPEVRDRFMIDASSTGGRFALVEHRLEPNVLAAPMHLHTREDEYSYVLEGRLGATCNGEVVFATRGDLVFKPRGQWHTFWNAGDGPARILEIISPAGLEQLFRRLDAMDEPPPPEELAELAAGHGAQIDFAQTMALVESHSLSF